MRLDLILMFMFSGSRYDDDEGYAIKPFIDVKRSSCMREREKIQLRLTEQIKYQTREKSEANEFFYGRFSQVKPLAHDPHPPPTSRTCPIHILLNSH